ncbi:hypothetical protein AURDEDRAFT_147396 [Auricularia subglabra TFB-10046 SS5]|uniref:Inositol phospholipid biosynthesis protein Scs3 n=1 Tax=Auricularia subglabra (strain TFB-10046 / SS5) TaxID=717982 RepID=J0WS62_AURST|nr:hypothetical protein AURDEDRAFT_147396 [Auricularia subglabra TFB-10046 SS5]
MPLLSRPVQRALALVVATTLLGTAYSVLASTWLDTSNPLIANLPHPHHKASFFASKRNVFNTLFVKRAWAWTSLLVAANTLVNPRRAPQRIWRWALATAAWLAFASWFFGPSLRARAAALSGAECVVQLPYTPTGGDVGAHVLTVPAEYCVQRRPITTAEHAHLFQQAIGVASIPESWRGIPRLTRGHDVSGHVFLLSLSILTLVDDVATGAPFDALASRTQLAGGVATAALVALWYWMLLMTSVYFHSPLEKISGLVVGITAYLFTKIPMPTLTAPVEGAVSLEKKQQ